MIRFAAASALPALLFVSATPAPAQDAEKSYRWVIDAAEMHCTLVRPYPDDVTLAIKPAMVGSGMQVWVMDRDVGLEEGASEAEGTVSLEGHGMVEGENPWFRAYDSHTRERVRIAYTSADALAAAMADNRLAMDFGRDGSFDLSVPSAEKALAALDMCRIDLQRSLGITDDVLAAIAVPPKEVWNGFNASDFPTYEKRAGIEADVRYFGWVEADGSVSGCKLVQPSGVHRFDRTACRNLENKAEYEPARDADGNAVRAPIERTISFRIRGRIPQG